MRWLAWYYNGVVYSSDVMGWDELPSVGLVGLRVFKDDVYSDVFYGCDYTWMTEDGRFEQSDKYPDNVDPDRVKHGKMMSDLEWEITRARIHD